MVVRLYSLLPLHCWYVRNKLKIQLKVVSNLGVWVINLGTLFYVEIDMIALNKENGQVYSVEKSDLKNTKWEIINEKEWLDNKKIVKMTTRKSTVKARAKRKA